MNSTKWHNKRDALLPPGCPGRQASPVSKVKCLWARYVGVWGSVECSGKRVGWLHNWKGAIEIQVSSPVQWAAASGVPSDSSAAHLGSQQASAQRRCDQRWMTSYERQFEKGMCNLIKGNGQVGESGLKPTGLGWYLYITMHWDSWALVCVSWTHQVPLPWFKRCTEGYISCLGFVLHILWYVHLYNVVVTVVSVEFSFASPI